MMRGRKGKELEKYPDHARGNTIDQHDCAD
jgi:hypothetical protein